MIHNPDGLDDDTVGDRHRLLHKHEMGRFYGKCDFWNKTLSMWIYEGTSRQENTTYRVPIDTPIEPEKPAGSGADVTLEDCVRKQGEHLLKLSQQLTKWFMHAEKIADSHIKLLDRVEKLEKIIYK